MASHAATQSKWTTPSKGAPIARAQSADAAAASNNLASSSVSSPSANDGDCAEVDELLEGIERVRVDDLWTTPRSAAPSPGTAPFRAGLFAPPGASGIAAISRPPPLRSKALADVLASLEPEVPHRQQTQQRPALPRTVSEPGRPRARPQAAVAFSAACGHGHGREHGHVHGHGHGHAHHHHHHPPASQAPPRISRTQSAAAAPRSGVGATADPVADFPHLFKVYPCATASACYAAGTHADCFYYHSAETDRRRAAVTTYRPHMCRFIEEAGGCRKGDRCPFAHNDFERRYHPDRFGKETCRDFLRGDCPRKYCTFRHEVSDKVEAAIEAIDAMCDKEVLQLVLKLSDARGRALSEKLVRRFGHGKKHSGWRLEGFNPRGRDDQKVKFVTARVEEVKRRLRAAGERKWAASLKTSSLRDMMSGVRKVAEEMRERAQRASPAAEDARASVAPETQRLIRAVFSNTNWSCHSQEGDNPFVVTPENQADAMTALERLVDKHVARAVAAAAGDLRAQRPPALAHARSQPAMHFQQAGAQAGGRQTGAGWMRANGQQQMAGQQQLYHHAAAAQRAGQWQ